MEEDARLAFNVKVLRRHDPSITEIIESASFVVLYSHQNEWTKTGVEGPMFLFRRSSPPYNGFFIMNRNGVENFSADMTPDDDLEITPEFIIYRPESSDNAIYGIWIFEPSQRLSVGEKMLQLQQMPSPSPAPAQPSTAPSTSTTTASDPAAYQPSTTNQPSSISLDALFGAPTSADDPASKQASPPATKSISLLDAMFGQASLQTGVPDHYTRATRGLTASPPSDRGAQHIQGSTTPDPNASSGNGSLGQAQLCSMSSTTGESYEQRSEVGSLPTGRANGASSALETKRSTDGNDASQKRADDAKKGSSMVDLVTNGIEGRLALGDDGQPLTRREFVTHLLSLIHTDKSFVDEIHSAYLEQTQALSK
ncbi:PH domain-like protein [Violaceomyces palustris]|uniref:PH domain-like protein n=1 Tax=Violaceomyces palustris TaxID=1673888 RepID=A0ACD0NZP1_9BASI|nr:PH domain-like protein [Violaceomyces palustris]